jgi:DNA-binding NtrC family response regulator
MLVEDIDELSPGQQGSVLRLIQAGRRVVATATPLFRQRLQDGAIRSDLYSRLGGQPVPSVSLRERQADVEVLAQHFLDELNETGGTQRRFASGLVDRMRAHAWPGNVRELRNRVSALYHLTEGPEIDGELPEAPGILAQTGANTGLVTRVAPLAEIEKDAIRLALEATGGDRREAARRLGISRSTLYVRIRDLAL